LIAIIRGPKERGAEVAEIAGGLRERNKREKLTRSARRRAPCSPSAASRPRPRARSARARASHGTLFLYVRDKRELLFLTFEEDARRIFADGVRPRRASATSSASSWRCSAAS